MRYSTLGFALGAALIFAGCGGGMYTSGAFNSGAQATAAAIAWGRCEVPPFVEMIVRAIRARAIAACSRSYVD